MYGAEIGIFEQVHHERFGGFLQRLDGLGLPTEGLAAGGDEGQGDFADLADCLLASGGTIHGVEEEGKAKDIRGGRKAV